MKTLFAVVLGVLLLIATESSATIRFVNQFGTAQFLTITDAVTAAANGDTIMIAPGTYNENANPSNKRLYFMGAGWDLTIINGGLNLFNGATNTCCIF